MYNNTGTLMYAWFINGDVTLRSPNSLLVKCNALITEVNKNVRGRA